MMAFLLQRALVLYPLLLAFVSRMPCKTTAALVHELLHLDVLPPLPHHAQLLPFPRGGARGSRRDHGTIPLLASTRHR
jgi:hypothetical protein